MNVGGAQCQRREVRDNDEDASGTEMENLVST